MSRRSAAWLSRALFVTATAAVAVSVPLWFAIQRSADAMSIIVIGDATAPRVAELRAELQERVAEDGSFLPDGPNVGFVLVFLLCLGWIAVGSIIVSRQPSNWAGWLFVVVGLPLPLLSLAQSMVVYGARVPGADVPGLGAWAILGEYVLYPVALLPLLFLLFPDGTLPSPRWRWAVGGLLGGVALSLVAFMFRPGPLNNWVESGILYVNPLGVDAFAGIGGALIGVGAVVALVSGASTVVAVRRRFRRATGDERQRMRWLRFVASAAGISFLAQWLTLPIFELVGDGDAPIFESLFILTAMILVVGVPAAYLVAIFRHGLWELDLVMRKTVQYAIVLVLVLALVTVAVAAVPALVLRTQTEADPFPVLLTAAVLAAAFIWLRPRAARLADRVVYGRRATPYEVLSAFSERVGETFSVEDVLPRMAQLVADATGATRVDVWLLVGTSLRPEVTWPADAPTPSPRRVVDDAVPTSGAEHAVEVRHRGELLGAITLEPAADDPIDPAKESLVRDLAAQAGLVLRNVRLIEELRASRQRLVAAQDQERRRLERNIHDGVQQQLVALAVQLRLAEQLTARDPDRAAAMLAELQTRTTDALDDLRDLARGIYPPLLADQGLGAALTAQARKAAVPVTIDVDGIRRYAQSVEAAVYFSCLEALNNVAKYASASSTTVALAERDGALTFTVTDDGHGFDPNASSFGTGLQGITDRLQAIGGDVSIRSAPDAGTTVTGSVPVDGAA
jgi:signal transduction histidine kinase